MDQSRKDKPEEAPACAQNADAGSPSGGAEPERCFSAQHKLAAVTRLLRGEPLENLARELDITAARLSEWRDRALVGAEAAMKERERDSRDEELLRGLSPFRVLPTWLDGRRRKSRMSCWTSCSPARMPPLPCSRAGCLTN